jgi:hypothetical protein
MTGLEAELLALITDCKSVAREQLVRHFVLRRNMYPDAVHKAIWHLIVGAVVVETEGWLSLVVVGTEKADKPEKPPKELKVKKATKPKKYNEDGDRRCSACKQYLPVDQFTRHPTTCDRLQPACKACKLESMRRSRRSSPYVLNRLVGRPAHRSGTAP